MFCPSCGGEHADWAHKCPYCGTVNEAVDEQVYLQHLEDIRLRLDQTDEESEEVYRSHLGGSLKKMSKGLALLLAGSLVFALCLFLIGMNRNRINELKALDLLEWERTEFPKLDTWYEEGRYGDILDEYYSLLDQDTDRSIYNWKHYNFVCDFYPMHVFIAYATETLRAGEVPDSYDVYRTVYDGFELIYEFTDTKLETYAEGYKNNYGFGLSPEEVVWVKEYRAEAETLFREFYGWDEAAMRQLYDSCMNKDGYLDAQRCQELADKVREELIR